MSVISSKVTYTNNPFPQFVDVWIKTTGEGLTRAEAVRGSSAQESAETTGKAEGWPYTLPAPPPRLPYILCPAAHLTDVKLSSSPQSSLNFISPFTLHLYMKAHFPDTTI